ncbi:YhcN/YlaJ family sporulation lipoprotein [Candidatus Formimonas warabiya]|uniref:YhcN/YlaJ family sporulation lipoprotein n=1 Tax=Formimonas warabiya TaxID=1761012 RepID=A0A3G1KPF3_FORW1|nr:YhcN/YlaJ family sporulation lipoprotein [Candidatus Formimonas warabiya]ATW24327.1 hypothetical protein DCMF_05565 [Candidatus Formimonas warabiya]
MNRKILTCVLLGIFLFVSVIAVGCAPAQKPVPTPEKSIVPAPARKIAPAPTPSGPQVPAPRKTASGRSMDLSRAKLITQKVDALPDVKKCTVVVTKNTAYIGLTLEPGAKKETTEPAVSSKVMSTEPLINTVYVTSDPRMVSRLKRIHDEIAGGKPITNFTKDLAVIAGSMSTRTTTP